MKKSTFTITTANGLTSAAHDRIRDVIEKELFLIKYATNENGSFLIIPNETI